MKAPHLLLLVLIMIGCEPEPIPRWGEAQVYVDVIPTFLPHEHPEIETKVRASLDLLEVTINSENFKRFVMDGNINEDNKEAYEHFMGSDLYMTIQIADAYPNIRGFHVNDQNIIFVHNNDFAMQQSDLYEFTAIMAHEYGHTIGFDHKEKWFTSFSYYLQSAGVDLFRYVHNNISHYPRQGQWLYLY